MIGLVVQENLLTTILKTVFIMINHLENMENHNEEKNNPDIGQLDNVYIGLIFN